jgi:hydroxymethylglutaryl-CoA lyase
MKQQILAKLGRTKVAIRDVGLREGLQSDHSQTIPTAEKARLFRGLAEAGVREINAVSFVSAKAMPHMADAEDLLRSLGSARKGVEISGLVLSAGGLERARRMKDEGLLDTILLVFSPVVDTLAANGVKPDIDALLEHIERTAEQGKAAGLKSVVFCSESFGSSTAGAVDPAMVVRTARRFSENPAVNEVVISDSAGQADPLQVMNLFDDLSKVLPTDRRITFHVHDSRGAGLANILAALLSPFENFTLDASFGGFGGDYPMVPDAFGNVATEDLAEMLEGMHIDTGIDVQKLVAVSRDYSKISGRPLVSRVSQCSGSLDWKKKKR